MKISKYVWEGRGAGGRSEVTEWGAQMSEPILSITVVLINWGFRVSVHANVPSTTVSHAEWWETPIEFPARQVYSPASFRLTFLRVKTSMSLSVVFKPAVWEKVRKWAVNEKHVCQRMCSLKGQSCCHHEQIPFKDQFQKLISLSFNTLWCISWRWRCKSLKMPQTYSFIWKKSNCVVFIKNRRKYHICWRIALVANYSTYSTVFVAPG